MCNLKESVLEFIHTLIREKEILESYDVEETHEDIDINNTQNLSTMDKKIVFNKQQFIIALTQIITGVLGCLRVKDNQIRFDLEVLIKKVIPMSVQAIVDCVEFIPEEN